MIYFAGIANKSLFMAFLFQIAFLYKRDFFIEFLGPINKQEVKASDTNDVQTFEIHSYHIILAALLQRLRN